MSDKIKSIYDTNDTMFMIGGNECYSFFCDPCARKAIKDIAQARPGEFTTDAAADIFRIGYIMGKRAVRAKRKNAAVSKQDALNENEVPSEPSSIIVYTKGMQLDHKQEITGMLEKASSTQLFRLLKFIRAYLD